MIPLLAGLKIWSLGLKLGFLILIVSSIFGMGIWTGYKLGDDKYQALRVEMAEQQAETARKAADIAVELNKLVMEANARTAAVESAAQEAIVQLKTRVRTITKEVVREVEKPVYLECVIPDTGRMLLYDAVREANTAVKSSDPVP